MDDTLYIRSKAAERVRKGKPATFTQDGFERWAATEAPSRVEQIQEMPVTPPPPPPKSSVAPSTTSSSPLNKMEVAGGRHPQHMFPSTRGMHGVHGGARAKHEAKARGHRMIAEGYANLFQGETGMHPEELRGSGFLSSALSAAKKVGTTALSLAKKGVTTLVKNAPAIAKTAVKLAPAAAILAAKYYEHTGQAEKAEKALNLASFLSPAEKEAAAEEEAAIEEEAAAEEEAAGSGMRVGGTGPVRRMAHLASPYITAARPARHAMVGRGMRGDGFFSDLGALAKKGVESAKKGLAAYEKYAPVVSKLTGVSLPEAKHEIFSQFKKATGGRKARAPSARNMMVKRVMAERGVSLPEASRIVKQEGLA
jgi:hypothetical protein